MNLINDVEQPIEASFCKSISVLRLSNVPFTSKNAASTSFSEKASYIFTHRFVILSIQDLSYRNPH